jgi:hypothetical protein
MDAIDARIETLLCEVRKLRICRNALALVNQLPTELLLIIFRFALAGAAASEFRLVTHTCHTWRQLALHTSSFWQTIDNDPVDAVETYMLRSGSLPLTITYGDPEDHEGQTLKSEAMIHSLSSLSRTEDITIYAPQTTMQLALIRMARVSAPLLRALTLGQVKDPDEPLMGLDLRAPFLNSLALFDIYPNSTSNYLSAYLEELSVYCSDIGDITPKPLSFWVEVLHRVPSIRNLSIRQPLSSNQELEVPLLGPVALPHLRHMLLAGLARAVCSLFNNLETPPPNATLDFVLYTMAEDPREELDHIASSLEPWIIRTTKDFKARAVRLVVGDNEVTLNAYRTHSLKRVLAPDSDSHYLSIQISGLSGGQALLATASPGFSRLCRTLSPQIVVLRRPPHTREASRAASEYLSSCTSAETLVFVGNNSSVLCFMCIFSEITSETLLDQWTNLRTIVFDSVELTDAFASNLASDYSSRLVGEVHFRRATNVRSEFLDMFKNRGLKVEWDGRGMPKPAV